MPTFDKVHPVLHSAGKMFDLVGDVERYPEFVPLCKSLTIRSRRDKRHCELLITDMSVGYKAIKESFTCQVLLNRPDLLIDVKYIDGPFRHLDNRWHFAATGEHSCDVNFHIDYEFKSRMLGLLMGSMFETAFKRFTAAFEKRADTLYA